MPEFTNQDREMIGAEYVLWAAIRILDDMPPAGIWARKIEDWTEGLRKLAVEIRDYNDDFERST